MHEGEREDSTVFIANHKIQLTGSANTLVYIIGIIISWQSTSTACTYLSVRVPRSWCSVRVELAEPRNHLLHRGL